MKRSRRIILASCLVTICGCGTFSDALCGPANSDRYYRGVRFDLKAMREGGAKVLLVADLPFSAVTDTLLVPSIAHEEWNATRPGQVPSEAASILESRAAESSTTEITPATTRQ